MDHLEEGCLTEFWLPLVHLFFQLPARQEVLPSPESRGDSLWTADRRWRTSTTCAVFVSL